MGGLSGPGRAGPGRAGPFKGDLKRRKREKKRADWTRCFKVDGSGNWQRCNVKEAETKTLPQNVFAFGRAV